MTVKELIEELKKQPQNDCVVGVWRNKKMFYVQIVYRPKVLGVKVCALTHSLFPATHPLVKL